MKRRILANYDATKKPMRGDILMSKKFVAYPTSYIRSSDESAILKKQVRGIEKRVLSNSSVLSAIGGDSRLKVLLKIYSNIVNQSGVDCATLTVNLECNGRHKLGQFVAAPEGSAVDTEKLLMSGSRVIELTPNTTLSDSAVYELESSTVRLLLSAIEAAKADLREGSTVSDNGPADAKQFGLQIAHTIVNDVNKRIRGAGLTVQDVSVELVNEDEVLFTCDISDSLGLELNIYKGSTGKWDTLGRDWEYEADDLVDLLGS